MFIRRNISGCIIEGKISIPVMILGLGLQK